MKLGLGRGKRGARAERHAEIGPPGLPIAVARQQTGLDEERAGECERRSEEVRDEHRTRSRQAEGQRR
jgi:hypothetical protein